MSEKLTKAEISKLYDDKCAIERWLNPPPPDPEQWPPEGWARHPDGVHYYRVLTAEQLREELFGSPARDEWRKQAREHLAGINATLQAHFFPEPKDEGTQRVTRNGFVAMLKTGLDRKIDETALPDVQDTVPEGTEAKCVRWEPKLDLRAYRELPKKLRDALEPAFIIRPTKPEFELVPKGK